MFGSISDEVSVYRYALHRFKIRNLDAQTWIANDNSLSPAQVARARELLQELLITITTKPDVPIAGKFIKKI